jgi:hypothetical protein
VALGWEEGGENVSRFRYLISDPRYEFLHFRSAAVATAFHAGVLEVVNAGLAQSVVDANGLGDLAG